MADKDVTPVISNTTYDIYKNFVELILPGVGALYFSLAQIWALPYGEQVVGTVAALALFLGLFLRFSRNRYNNSEEKYDGAIIVDTHNPEKDTFTVDVPVNSLLGDKNEVLLKIDQSQ